MSNFRLQFCGDVRKPETKTFGGKTFVEFSLMRKNYTKEGAEATFTWLKISVSDPKEWQLSQLAEGKFISGSGEFSTRSFTDKDGNKRQSAEVRCSSFDVAGPRTESASSTKKEEPAKDVQRIPDKAHTATDEGIPF